MSERYTEQALFDATEYEVLNNHVDNRMHARTQFEDLAWGEVDRGRITAEMAEMAIWMCVDWADEAER